MRDVASGRCKEALIGELLVELADLCVLAERAQPAPGDENAWRKSIASAKRLIHRTVPATDD